MPQSAGLCYIDTLRSTRETLQDLPSCSPHPFLMHMHASPAPLDKVPLSSSCSFLGSFQAVSFGRSCCFISIEALSLQDVSHTEDRQRLRLDSEIAIKVGYVASWL